MLGTDSVTSLPSFDFDSLQLLKQAEWRQLTKSPGSLVRELVAFPLFHRASHGASQAWGVLICAPVLYGRSPFPD